MTIEQRDYAVELLKQGWKSQAVADRYGVTRQYIERLADERYQPRRKGDPAKDETLLAIKEELDTVRAMGQNPRVLPRHGVLIAQRYCEGVARLKPFIRASLIAEYLGVSWHQIEPYTSRRENTPRIKKLIKQAKGVRQ